MGKEERGGDKKSQNVNVVTRRKALSKMATAAIGAGAVIVVGGVAYYLSSQAPPATTTTTAAATTSEVMTTAAPATSTAATAAPAVTIDAWSQAGPQYEIHKHAGETYHAAHPNVTVTDEQVDDTTFEATYNTRISTAPPPDVAFNYAGPTHTYPLADAGLLLELDDAAVKYGWDKFQVGMGYKKYLFNGHYYAVPHDYVAYPFIYYNPDIFAQVGVGEPKTLQEFYDICDKVRAKGYLSCTFGSASAAGFMSNVTTFFLSNLLDRDKVTAFVTSYGYDLTKPSFKDRTVKFTDPEFLKTLQLQKEFSDKVYLKGYLGQSDDDAVGLFAGGKAAMYQCGSWGPAVLDPVVQTFKYKVFTVPTDFGTVAAPPRIASVDNCYAICAKTKYPDVCLDFLNEMLSMEEQTWAANSQGIFPARNDLDPAVITNPHMQVNFGLFRQHDPLQVIQLQLNAKIAPSPWYETLGGVLSGTLTPQAALNRMEDAAQKASQGG